MDNKIYIVAPDTLERFNVLRKYMSELLLDLEGSVFQSETLYDDNLHLVKENHSLAERLSTRDGENMRLMELLTENKIDFQEVD